MLCFVGPSSPLLTKMLHFVSDNSTLLWHFNGAQHFLQLFHSKVLTGNWSDHVQQDTEGPVTWNRWRKCGVCISWNQKQLHIYSKQGISSNLELKASNKYINKDLRLVILHPKSLFSLRSINADMLNKTHLCRLLTHAKHGAEQTFQLIFRIQCFKHQTLLFRSILNCLGLRD